MLPSYIEPASEFAHRETVGSYIVQRRHGVAWWQVLDAATSKFLAAVPHELTGSSMTKIVLAAELIAKARAEGANEGFDMALATLEAKRAQA